MSAEMLWGSADVAVGVLGGSGGRPWALSPGVSHAELLLALPRGLQLFKESSHQVEKERPH